MHTTVNYCTNKWVTLRMTKINLEELFATENEQLQKLNDIVAKSIEEEKLLSEKILEFEETSDEIKTLIIKIDDDEYDLTKKYFEMSKNLIYYEND